MVSFKKPFSFFRADQRVIINIKWEAGAQLPRIADSKHFRIRYLVIPFHFFFILFGNRA
ncbi:Uncharacterised protein [Mycobacteroides abscessus subsp. abscessus]|nr:Uncharacterised protein [Mycobacteroides abscessus subsp. abscessus]